MSISPATTPDIVVADKAKVNSRVSQVVGIALNQGFQIAPDAIKLLQRVMEKNLSSKSGAELNLVSVIGLVVENKSRQGNSSTILKNDLVELLPDIFSDLDVESRTASSVVTDHVESGSSNMQSTSTDSKPEIEVIRTGSENREPTGIEGFAFLFKNRYEKILRIFGERPEARQLVKISRVVTVDKGTSRVAGLLLSRRQTKNGIELTIDDDTGKLSFFATGDNAKKASQIALDQCVMFDLESKQGRLFVRNVIQPDLPNRVASTSKKTVYTVFLSDLHIGSNKFLDGAFNRFLEWLSGNYRQQEIDEEIIRRLKYVIIGGDIVDGVGVFPNQEYELAESDIYKQYRMVYEKISSIPSHLQVLVIPGNHDSTRQALPQPMIPKKYAESLYSLPNMMMLGDPCMVKLHGVSVMVFHGRSLDDVLATTPGLSYEQPTEAMKVLLKARHLAPIFGQRTPIAPDIEDHLVIEQAPDIFHAGHVHSVGVDSYKGTLMINSGTWQAQTGYQANLGIMPRPGLVPVVNLATLEVTLRDFLTADQIIS